jgi:hypothetical protein
MTYRGPYTNRVSRRRRTYTGRIRAGPRRGGIMVIVAIAVVAAALAYDLGRSLRETANGPKIKPAPSIAQESSAPVGAPGGTGR